MAGVNKVIIVGNLGIDPEIKTLESGAKLARLSIATSESYMNKEGHRIEQTEWHRVILWRGLADIAERYLSKGKQVYIEGKLRTRSWKDQDGNDRYATEIVADNMQLLGRPSDNQSSASGERQQASAPKAQAQAVQQAAGSDADDDLPF